MAMMGVLLMIVMLGSCAMFLGGTATELRDLDGMTTVALPKDWGRTDKIDKQRWIAYPFMQQQSGRIGAGNPLEVEAYVIIAAPQTSVKDLEGAMDWAATQTRQKSMRFPEFGSYKNGDRETWLAQGTYQDSPGHNPEKVTFVRSVDRVKKVAFAARVYERKISNERLLKIVDGMHTSIVFTSKRGSVFQQSGAWIGISSMRRASELAVASAALAMEGAGPVGEPGEVIEKSGWVYQQQAGRFLIGRRLGERVRNTPDYDADKELTWLAYDNGWKGFTTTDGRVTEQVPGEWAKILGPNADPSKRYYFTVKAVPITIDGPAEPIDTSEWKLAEWFEKAKRVEADFRAGKLRLE